MFPREEASNILGWMSVACWITVFTPQFYENYVLQSGEGLSVLFILIWLLGDITNLLGAAMAGLLPTIIVLAVYYTICDTILLIQVYYYRWRVRRRQKRLEEVGETDETTALLAREGEAPQVVLFGRKKMYVYASIFIVFTTVVATLVNRAERDEGQPPAHGGRPGEVIEWKSQLLGWTSAVLYLGSRVPQIVKNVKTKCEGLSLDMFVFTLGGNITYVLSILVADTSKEHIIANASWLAGSGLTVFLDFIVLYQFYYYRAKARQLAN